MLEQARIRALRRAVFPALVHAILLPYQLVNDQAADPRNENLAANKAIPNNGGSSLLVRRYRLVKRIEVFQKNYSRYSDFHYKNHFSDYNYFAMQL